MSRGAQTFKQGDITKAARAAVKAGLTVKAIEIDAREGKFVVITGDLPSPKPGNEWDSVK